jgi:hypothetical protein
LWDSARFVVSLPVLRRAHLELPEVQGSFDLGQNDGHFRRFDEEQGAVIRDGSAKEVSFMATVKIVLEGNDCRELVAESVGEYGRTALRLRRVRLTVQSSSKAEQSGFSRISPASIEVNLCELHNLANALYSM